VSWQAPVPESEGGGRPNLHHRMAGLDLGGDDRRHRPSCCQIEKDLGGRTLPDARPGAGDLSRRPVPVAVFGLLELEPKSTVSRARWPIAKRNLDKPLTVGQLAAAAYLIHAIQPRLRAETANRRPRRREPAPRRPPG